MLSSAIPTPGEAAGLDKQQEAFTCLKQKIMTTSLPEMRIHSRHVATLVLYRNNQMGRTTERSDRVEMLKNFRSRNEVSPLSPVQSRVSWRDRLLPRSWFTASTPSRRRYSNMPPAPAPPPFALSTTDRDDMTPRYLRAIAPQLFRPESSSSTAPTSKREWSERYLRDQGAVIGWERILREMQRRQRVSKPGRNGVIWTYASSMEGMDDADELLREEFELLARQERRSRERGRAPLVNFNNQRIGLAICGPSFRIYVYETRKQVFHPPIQMDLGGSILLDERTFDIRARTSLAFLRAAIEAVRQAGLGIPIDRRALLPPRVQMQILALPDEPVLCNLSPPPSMCSSGSDASSTCSVPPHVPYNSGGHIGWIASEVGKDESTQGTEEMDEVQCVLGDLSS